MTEFEKLLDKLHDVGIRLDRSRSEFDRALSAHASLKLAASRGEEWAKAKLPESVRRIQECEENIKLATQSFRRFDALLFAERKRIILASNKPIGPPPGWR